MEYTEAKELIIRGRVGDALALLRTPLRGSSLYDEWILLNSLYAQLEEQEMKGLLSSQELSIERNRITDSTLRLLDRAKADASVPVEDTARPKAMAGKLLLRPIALSLGLMALLTLAYFVWPASSAQDVQPLPTSTEVDEPAQAEAEAAPSPQPIKPVKTERQVPAAAESDGRQTTEVAPRRPPGKAEASPPRQPPVETRAEVPPTTPSRPPVADESAKDRYDRYVIRKKVNNDYLPFELHQLGIGEQHVYLELTVHNEGSKAVEIKEVYMLHTGDQSSASSFNLEGRVVPAAQQEKLTAKFRWQLGSPAAFRMKLIYRFTDERSWREVKNDFGVYQRAD
jgi:hypothetical protein